MNNTFSVSVNTADRTLASIGRYTIAPDRVTFLFGESGIGKSIISKALYGLLNPQELEVTVNGMPYTEYLREPWVKEIQKNSFFVFQEPSTHLNPLQKITTQLSEGTLGGSKYAKEILSVLWKNRSGKNLDTILDVYPKPYRPSGGEKQRALLAMAFKKISLLHGRQDRMPTYFCFDEPTGSLDNDYRNLFLQMLFDAYRQYRFTAVVITHDYSIISEIYDQYRDLLDRVDFMELTRAEDMGLRLDRFEADKYLNWLKATDPMPPVQAGREVLRVGAKFRVFGRSLYMTADEGSDEPSDLVIRKGEMVYLKAASGVGKTTLAKIVMGLYRADELDMKLAGFSFTHETPEQVWHKKIWGKKAGMVFQHADESLNLSATVSEVFDGLPLPEPLTTDQLRRRLSHLLTQRVDDGFLKKKVRYLSGGQKQCLNLLRTFISRPDLIVMDEPLNGLDFNRVQRVLALITDACASGTAILIITHNEEIMEHLVDKKHIRYLKEETA